MRALDMYVKNADSIIEHAVMLSAERRKTRNPQN